MPKDYQWEHHNPLAFEEALQKEKQGHFGALDEYYANYRESVEQREERWEKQFIRKELQISNIKDFEEYKKDPQSFIRKMGELGRVIGKHWSKPPIKPVGQGELKQNLDGSWQQEYKPSSSTNMHKWLEKHSDLPNELPEELKALGEEQRRDRLRKWWDMMYNVTNNFSRGDHIARTIPGQGMGEAPVKYTDYSGWRE